MASKNNMVEKHVQSLRNIPRHYSVATVGLRRSVKLKPLLVVTVNQRFAHPNAQFGVSAEIPGSKVPILHFGLQRAPLKQVVPELQTIFPVYFGS